MKNIFYALLVLFCCTNLFAENNQITSSANYILPCIVSSITDGDTIRIVTQSHQVKKIRLYGIDTPEIDQTYGPEATEKLRKLIDGKSIILDIKGTDRYGRTVAIVMKDSVDIGLVLIKEGYAWAYRKYLDPVRLQKYVEAENYARSKKLGLWKNAGAVAPWDYRNGNK